MDSRLRRRDGETTGIAMKKEKMDKRKIIEILRQYKKEFAGQYGILDIGVFGSVARDEAGEASDVDIVVRIVKPDLFIDRKSTRLNSSHIPLSRMPSSA